MGRRPRPLALLAVAVLLVFIAACGSKSDEAADEAATPVAADSESPDTETTDSDGGAAGDSVDTTPEAEAEPTPTPPTPVPPQPTDPEVEDTPTDVGAGPDAGRLLSVVGVESGDVLNFREEPDPGAAIVTQEPPTPQTPGRVIAATSWSAPHGSETWWQVTIDDALAWANARFLAVEGRTYELGWVLTGLESDGDLGSTGLWNTVASTRFGDTVTSVVEVDAYADDAQTSQAWIDVMGTPVDGVVGERIHLVLANVIDDEPKLVGFEVLSATGTVLCDAGPPTGGDCDLPIDYAPPGCFFSIHQEQQCEYGGGEIDLETCECVPGT